MLGAPRTAGRSQGSYFPVTGMTQSPWFGLVAFLFLQQSSTHLSSLQKMTPVSNYQVPNKQNRRLRLWAWAQCLMIRSQLIWGKQLSGLLFRKENQTFPLAYFNR